MNGTAHPAWADPGPLSAACIRVGPGDEAAHPWLRAGTHLRVFPSPHIGFPICPFTVWSAGHARPGPWREGRDHWFAGSGEQALYVGAWGRNEGALSVLDAAGRTSGRRTCPQPFIARVPLPGVRYLPGQAGDDWIAPAVYEAGQDTGAGNRGLAWLDDPHPIDAVGSEVPRGFWWCGADPSFPSADLGRRMSGVPDRAPPYDGLQPDDAYGRAEAQASGLNDPVRDAWRATPHEPPPTSVSFPVNLPNSAKGSPPATARVEMGVALWAASLDPAAARWWGLATTLPAEADISQDGAACFAVAALFAFPKSASGPRKHWVERAEDLQHTPMAEAFTQLLVQVHASRDLGARVADLIGAGHHVGCLWTLAVAAPPPDVPDPPSGTLSDSGRRWNAERTWTAVLAVDGTGGGPLAVRREPDTPLNEYVLPGRPYRQPIVAARPLDGSPGVTVTDPRCPAGPATWRVATADMWGQWSHPGSVQGDPPALPRMPQPTVTLAFEPSVPPPTGDGPVSAGAVSIRVTLAPPAAAAPPVATVQAHSPQGAQYLSLDAEGDWTGTASVEATTPGRSTTVTCDVTVTDTEGREAEASATLDVHDPRPFVAQSYSHALLFTGQRRPDGFAELDVRADRPAGAPPGTSWHLYIADEQLLNPPAGREEARCSRAERLRAQVARLPDRSRMAQLTNAAVAEEAHALRIRCRLPGRLEQVQVLQLVPTTEYGVEAPVDRCGCFTVAVPLTDVPPAPTLTVLGGGIGGTGGSGGTDGSGGVGAVQNVVRLVLSVSQPGRRPADGTPPWPMLRRGTQGTAGPVARVRRSATGTPPSAWPVLRQLEMQADLPADPAAGWRWSATFRDELGPDVPSWTPLSYVCQVAWPDEPAWDPATTPVADTVRPAWSTPGARHSAWSAPSDVVTVVAPRRRPALRPVFTDHGDGTASLCVSVPPAHPRAGTWHLAASCTTHPHPVDVDGPGPRLRLDGLDSGVAAADWLLAVTTPDGELLPLTAGDGTAPDPPPP